MVGSSLDPRWSLQRIPPSVSAAAVHNNDMKPTTARYTSLPVGTTSVNPTLSQITNQPINLRAFWVSRFGLAVKALGG